MRAPTHTLRPEAWAVYADSLYDAGAPDADVLHARQIARALASKPRLVLLSSADGFAMRPQYVKRVFSVPGWRHLESRWITPARHCAHLVNRLAWRPEHAAAYLRDRLMTPWHLPRPRPPELVRAWFDTLPQLLEPGPPGGV